MMSNLLYIPALDAVRRTGLSLEELTPHIVVVNGEQQVAVAVVERLRASRNAAGMEEQRRYVAGEIEAGERKY